MSSKPVYINDIAAFLPNAPVPNERMEDILGLAGDRPSRAKKLILQSNNIQQRHYAIDPQTLQPNYTTAQLAAAAIRGLQQGRLDLDSISLLTAASTLPDQLMPNHAVMVHGELGNPPCEAVATSGVCVCGVTALKYAFLSIAAGEHANAVVSAAETASLSMLGSRFHVEDSASAERLKRQPELAFEQDFLRWMLSDGAGAMLLSEQRNDSSLSLRLDWIEVLSYANEQSACMYAGAIKNHDGSLSGWRTADSETLATQNMLAVKQDVKQLNAQVLHYTVEKALAQIVAKRGIRPDAYAYFLPHYSSHYFRDRLAQALARADFAIPQECWFTNLYTKGNTGSASIFIALEELFHAGKLQPGQQLLCYVPESGRFSTSFMQMTVV